ncbi:hypothetical protein V2J09_003430 [Rumex salicifolius]
MAILVALCYLTIFLLALILIFTLPFSPFSNKNGVPRDWPAGQGITVVLDHVATGGCLGSGGRGVVDLQDLFTRYTYDLTHRLVVGYDPNSLTIDWPQVPFSKAMNSAMQGIWMRHFLPEPLWKLQRRMGLGHEKALRKAKDFLNKIATVIVSNKHDDFNSRGCDTLGNDKFNDILTTYFIEDDHYNSGDGDDVLKGSFLSLMLAGQDTTSTALTWFFWTISQHPIIEAKIRAEVEGVISEDVGEKAHVFTPEEISKLVYLHASVCETLRLYPPVPFQTRTPREPDMLPSGHGVIPNSTMVIIPLYVMARMKSVWGKDCAEFKPERWIAEDGGFKHEPSHKFFTFNSGPRICLGREVALTQMKAAIATILYNYNVQVLKEQKVVPVYSVVLQMKYGLHAKVSKRWV